MAPKPRNRTPAWVAAGVLALFVMAGFTAVATAERPDRPDGPRDRMIDRARPIDRMPAAREADARSFTIDLSGTATDRDNQTYTILISGAGKARIRGEDGNVSALKGFARLNVTVLDANGTVVQDGKLRARLHVHETDEGFKWMLVAVGHHPRAGHLVLRGEATPEGEGFDLTGHGKAVKRVPHREGPKVLSLEVAGSVAPA